MYQNPHRGFRSSTWQYFAHGYEIKTEQNQQLRSLEMTSVLCGYDSKSSRILLVSIREVGGGRSRVLGKRNSADIACKAK